VTCFSCSGQLHVLNYVLLPINEVTSTEPQPRGHIPLRLSLCYPHRLERPDSIPLHRREDVRVDVQSCLNIAVTKALLHDFRVHTELEQVRRMRMP